MNIKEAYKILSVAETATDEELKSKHKELVFKYHPDRNKTDPNKLSEINSAYQYVQEYRANPSKFEPKHGFSSGFSGFGGININDILSDLQGGNFSSSDHQRPPPFINMKISFKESILGDDKPIKYKRFVKCKQCNGSGELHESNGCKSCNGYGRTILNNNGMVFAQSCNKCHGKNVKKSDCSHCASNGDIETEVSGSVHIPGGIVNNTTLRLQGAGHYQGGSVFGDAYTEVFVNVSVEKDDELQLMGIDVISNLKLSLLEALSGCNKEVKTINGNKEINIPKLSKNKDEIKLDGLGVKEANGSQRVVLNIEYPNDIKSLLEFLEEDKLSTNNSEEK